MTPRNCSLELINRRPPCYVGALTSRRSGLLAALILLDLTAAFDTVDHDILLQQTFGVDSNAHRWFRSYLVGRTKYVRRGVIRALVTRLGPLLFTLYIFDLIQLT